MLLSDHLGIEKHLFSLEDVVNGYADVREQILARLETDIPRKVLISVTRYKWDGSVYSLTFVYLFDFAYGINFGRSTDVFIENHVADAYAVNTIELKATLLCT